MLLLLLMFFFSLSLSLSLSFMLFMLFMMFMMFPLVFPIITQSGLYCHGMSISRVLIKNRNGCCLHVLFRYKHSQSQAAFTIIHTYLVFSRARENFLYLFTSILSCKSHLFSFKFVIELLIIKKLPDKSNLTKGESIFFILFVALIVKTWENFTLL